MEIKYLGTAAAEGWPAVFCTCEACKRARVFKQLSIANLENNEKSSRSHSAVLNFCVIFWPYYKLYSCYTNISIHKFLDIPSEIPYTKQCAAGEIAVPCTRNPLQRG